MRIITILLFLFTLLPFSGKSQTTKPNLWQVIPKTQQKLTKSEASQHLFQLDLPLLSKSLQKAHSKDFDSSHEKLILSFPLPNGKLQEYLIFESTNFHQDLAQKYPDIKAFYGKGIRDQSASIRFSFSPQGIQGIVLSGNFDPVFIEPIDKTTSEFYRIEYKKDLASIPFNCEVEDILQKKVPLANSQARSKAIDCQLKTFRLALGCTGEYTQYHGGTTAAALAAMNSTLTIVNAIFERDIGVNLQLIPNTTDLIFMDANTDPYSNSDVGRMLGEHQEACDQKIGSDNYDIGHVFGTASGGIAFLGVVCKSSFKAGGATGLTRPEGAIFAVDLVCHEIAHQFGATHSFNGDQVACSGSNRSDDNAVEPGSGSTIMGYAGICAPQNVQNNSDPYFHANSIQQMKTFVISDTDCGVQVTTFENNPPKINIAKTVYSIPIATPFALTFNASDEDNNELSYCWEQMDNEIAPQPPSGNSTGGPLFRSLTPTTDPTRYFPNLIDLSQNKTNIWEVLPTVARQMNFRGTVRDNNLGGGCTESVDLEIEVLDILPFRVISPNTNIEWVAGTQQTINWDVGSTRKSPVNTEKVDLLLSTDGGASFPILLVANAPNSGSKVILVPNEVSKNVRIMVRAVDNIFFDINNQDIEITKPENDFEINVIEAVEVCAPSAAVFPIFLGETGNFTESINLSVKNLPAGAIASFSNANPSVPDSVSLTITGTNNLFGSYEFDLIATGNLVEKTRTLKVEIAQEIPTSINLQEPANNRSNVVLTPVFIWEKSPLATGYLLEIADNIDFNNPIRHLSEINTYQLQTQLVNDQKYFWRAMPQNGCGNGGISTIFTFETLNEVCIIGQPTDIPKPISEVLRVTVRSEITLPTEGTIISVKVKDLNITHTFVGDLAISLKSPAGTIVRLLENRCDNFQNYDLSFDDDSPLENSAFPCGAANVVVQPLDPLAIFAGEKMNGIWELLVEDTELFDGGSLENWELEICYQVIKPLTIISSSQKEVSCAGGADGQASITVEGGTGIYQYQWSNGSNNPTIGNLSAGNYEVTISDGENSENTVITIQEPQPMIVSTSILLDGCIGTGKGILEASATGGTQPYYFQWSMGQSSPLVDNLSSGFYQLTVTDSLGCQEFDTTEILSFPLVDLVLVDLQNPNCPEDFQGSAEVMALNGSGNYTYLWSNGNTGTSQTALPIGSYTITATDENGCNDNITLIIEQEMDQIAPILELKTANLYLDADGFARLTEMDIVAESFDNCGEVNFSFGQIDFTCQSAESQTLIVAAFDKSGNETIGEIGLTILDTLAPIFDCIDNLVLIGCEPISPNKYPTATDNCSSVQVTLIEAGEKGYHQDPNIFSFRATDKNNNETVCYVPFSRVNNLQVESQIQFPSCYGALDGAASIIPIAGQGPFTYLWNDPESQTSAEATNLGTGDYSVIIQDNTGCSLEKSIQIIAPERLLVKEFRITHTVNDLQNGRIEIMALYGGTGQLKTNWYQNDSLIGNGLLIDSLAAGTYEIQITDENNCQLSTLFVVDQLTPTTNLNFIEQLNLFPNPTAGNVNLQLDLANKMPFSLTLYDFTGRQIAEPTYFQLKSIKHQINFSIFENGVYFVKLGFEEGVILKKVLLIK